MHSYTAGVAWSGSTGVGYDGYDRRHAGVSKARFRVAAVQPMPRSCGDPACLNPEELLVLAAASCQLLSFLAVAARARIDVIDYRDDGRWADACGRFDADHAASADRRRGSRCRHAARSTRPACFIFARSLTASATSRTACVQPILGRPDRYDLSGYRRAGDPPQPGIVTPAPYIDAAEARKFDFRLRAAISATEPSSVARSPTDRRIEEAVPPRARTEPTEPNGAASGASGSLSRSGGLRLVIVESPAKARTIAGYLGDGYLVESSIGHIRDLPRNAADVPAAVKSQPWSRLGVDVDNGFEPLYIVTADKKAAGRQAQGAAEGRHRALPRDG